MILRTEPQLKAFNTRDLTILLAGFDDEIVEACKGKTRIPLNKLQKQRALIAKVLASRTDK